MSTERVRLEVADHVAVATLTRPEKHNALDVAMFEAIDVMLERLAGERGVRAVVLHGDGPSFCSGLDVVSVMSAGEGLEGLVARLREEPPNWFQRVAHGWTQLPMPVIAAVHGTCFGGGLQIALAADVRIASPNARLSVMEARWGLIPDMSITRTLPRLVRIDVAKELTYTGRVLSASEALQLGLVTWVAGDPLAAARALATEIASRSPDAVRAAKRLFDESWTARPEQSLALEAELQRALIGSPNQLAAVQVGIHQGAGRVRGSVGAVWGRRSRRPCDDSRCCCDHPRYLSGCGSLGTTGEGSQAGCSHTGGQSSRSGERRACAGESRRSALTLRGSTLFRTWRGRRRAASPPPQRVTPTGWAGPLFRLDPSDTYVCSAFRPDGTRMPAPLDWTAIGRARADPLRGSPAAVTPGSGPGDEGSSPSPAAAVGQG